MTFGIDKDSLEEVNEWSISQSDKPYLITNGLRNCTAPILNLWSRVRLGHFLIFMCADATSQKRYRAEEFIRKSLTLSFGLLTEKYWAQEAYEKLIEFTSKHPEIPKIVTSVKELGHEKITELSCAVSELSSRILMEDHTPESVYITWWNAYSTDGFETYLSALETYVRVFGEKTRVLASPSMIKSSWYANGKSVLIDNSEPDDRQIYLSGYSEQGSRLPHDFLASDARKILTPFFEEAQEINEEYRSRSKKVQGMMVSKD